jgi:hypothetical protein
MTVASKAATFLWVVEAKRVATTTRGGAAIMAEMTTTTTIMAEMREGVRGCRELPFAASRWRRWGEGVAVVAGCCYGAVAGVAVS